MRERRKRKTERKNSGKRRNYLNQLGIEGLETRAMLAGDVVAATDSDPVDMDVNQDGLVGPIDAMMVVNHLAQQQNGSARFVAHLDLNSDGTVSPLDALMVMNQLNRGGDGGSQNNNGSPGGGRGNHGGHGGDHGDPDHQSDADVVLDWNNLFNEVLVDSVENQNPGFASRAMAMLNVAIYDTVGIASDGHDAETFYEYEGDILRTGGSISTDVAVSQAAHTVLSSLYPDQQAEIDAFLDRQTGRNRSGDNRNSVELGSKIGEAVLAARANDGFDTVADYTYTDGVGSFQPDPLNPDVPVWGPAWGEVDTFAISSVDSFTPETTPALTSEEYAASYNEVLELGSVNSKVRTADQTEAGIFWAYDRTGLGTPMSLFSDVLESIAVQEGNSLEENAALFAQASVAMADAGVVAWNTKFSEEFWRPVTAIHDGDIDGNSLTEGDEDWVALGAPDGGDDIVGFTPQFPTYISGHATFGGALFGAIQEFYGTDDISFEVESNELAILLENPELQEAYGLDLDDATRSFDSLSEAMAENGRSRVYLGIHFDFDDLVGQKVGQAVASSVASEFEVASDDGSGGNNHGDHGNNHGGSAGNHGGPYGNPGGHGLRGMNRSDSMVDAPPGMNFQRQGQLGARSDLESSRNDSHRRDPAADRLRMLDSIFADSDN